MLNANYVLGLVDGEGSFTVYVNNPEISTARKRRVRIEPKFYVKLVEEDKKILYEFQKFFSCGNVYYQKDSRTNHKDCYRFEVGSRKDIIESIIPFFSANKLKFETKKRDFNIFCKIVESIKQNEHLTDQGLLKLFKLKQQMH
jgi:hypothetical protein